MAEPAVKGDKELFTIEPWDEHNHGRCRPGHHRREHPSLPNPGGVY